MRRRLLGRTEVVLLAVVGALLFTFVASTPAPGLQTVVAGVACPAGTTSSAVVRYPHVPSTSEMVRNTPLVCVTSDRAELASHWRVLPALFVVGLALAVAAVVAGSVVAGVARRARTETVGEVPARRRTTLETVRFVPLLVGLPFVFLALYGGYWWLAVDTPYRVSSCRSSEGGPATCYDGEPVYRVFAVGVGLAAAGCVGLWVLAVVRSVGRDRAFRRAWVDGIRTTATLVADEATNTEINGRRLRRFTYEVRPADGGAPFRFEEKATSSAPVPIGGTVPVVYDRDDPTQAFVVL
jgi:hypothetical protein